MTIARSTLGASLASAVIVGAFALTGCGKEEPPPKTAVTETTATPPPEDKPSSGLNVSKDIRDACGIVGKVEEAPKFDFDEHDLLPSEKDILNQVAKCLTTGPLKGRSVLLTGRADPRGEQEYNMALGSRRANAVFQYLASLGVAKDHMGQTSRGELDANGTDEASWRVDRRVDVTLKK